VTGGLRRRETAAAGDLAGARFPGEMKYVLVTGGVVSGLGKGVTASSIGVVLKSCGLRITSIKIGTPAAAAAPLPPPAINLSVQETGFGAGKERVVVDGFSRGFGSGGS
jgi:hypothetical protein